uniref:Uncharacterized protein n=1 Tax=Trichobilharzia regenti TaxID=157069 RepID=A0AA85KC50_TRIRE|nr:unnamed protein product [Trichobilharzia regenti]
MHSKSTSVKDYSGPPEIRKHKNSKICYGVADEVFTQDLNAILREELQIADRHKSNYETLKSAFKKLYNAYNQLESRLNSSANDSKLLERQQQQQQQQGDIHLMEARNNLNEYISAMEIVKQSNSIPAVETLEISMLKITNELEAKYREQILNLQYDLQSCQNENRLLVEEIQNLNKTLNQERSEFKNTLMNSKLFYEAEISSLQKIKDHQNTEINQLSLVQTNEDKKILLQNAQLQAKCDELSNQLELIRNNLSKEREQIQLENEDQLQLCSELKAKNMELEAICSTQKNHINALTQEVNELRAELINHRQTLVESTKCQYKAETQIDKLLQSTRIELINLRKEAEYQKSEIDKQRSELTEKSRKLQDELDMLHNRLTCTNQFSGNRENNHFDVINTQNNNDEEEEKLQRIIKLFQKHFLLHINEFENKVSSISDRLNLEVDQMQTFQMHAKSIMETINQSSMYPKSFIPSQQQNGKTSDRIQLTLVQDNMQRYVDDARKKKRTLCLRIVLLKQKINFLESEIEKLREENINLKTNVASITEYERVCLAYKDLYRRHQEYERIILNSDNQKFITNNDHVGRLTEEE